MAKLQRCKIIDPDDRLEQMDELTIMALDDIINRIGNRMDSNKMLLVYLGEPYRFELTDRDYNLFPL